MLEYAKKVYAAILLELANLRQTCFRENFSPEQRKAFVEQSILQLHTYYLQLNTVVECLAESRQASGDINQDTSLVIPVDYKLEYTGSKVGLTELLYALTSLGTFNNGQATVRSIAEYFEKVFFVSLGNYTATFQDIRNRKTGNTKFIDSMKDSLEAWIDRLD